MRTTLATLALVAAALSGCVAADVTPASTAPLAGLTLADDAAAAPAESVQWTAELESRRGGANCFVIVCVGSVSPAEPCGERNCDVRALRLALPDAHWSANEGGLRVIALFGEEWNVTGVLRVLDADGRVLAEGRDGWFAAVAWVPEPPAGDITVELRATYGAGPIDVMARLESAPRDDTPRELLPNLVTRTPTELQVTSPWLEGLLAPAGIRGCGLDEIVEQGARRCLRFSNMVGNAGEGALEVRMSAADAAAGVAGQGTWMQRVFSSDGSSRDEAVGGAVFHAMHGHYHYEGLARYVVHHYDLETRTRGEPLNEGSKAGFCFLDSGIVDPALPVVAPVAYDGSGCLSPLEQGENFMGISAGWYDLYYYGLAEQYVDISGAPDGVYELVSTANADGTLLETDYEDNAASVLFRLTGDTVEVLGPP